MIKYINSINKTRFIKYNNKTRLLIYKIECKLYE